MRPGRTARSPAKPSREAHILVAFLGYGLNVTSRMKLSPSAPGLTPRAVLQSLSAIQMVEVHLPTTDGRVLVMPRRAEPEAEQKMILQALQLALPPPPPPTRPVLPQPPPTTRPMPVMPIHIGPGPVRP